MTLRSTMAACLIGVALVASDVVAQDTAEQLRNIERVVASEAGWTIPFSSEG
jgi:hypothetical protein